MGPIDIGTPLTPQQVRWRRLRRDAAASPAMKVLQAAPRNQENLMIVKMGLTNIPARRSSR